MIRHALYTYCSLSKSYKWKGGLVDHSTSVLLSIDHSCIEDVPILCHLHHIPSIVPPHQESQNETSIF